MNIHKRGCTQRFSKTNPLSKDNSIVIIVVRDAMPWRGYNLIMTITSTIILLYRIIGAMLARVIL
jgi:hypothetical protein